MTSLKWCTNEQKQASFIQLLHISLMTMFGPREVVEYPSICPTTDFEIEIPRPPGCPNMRVGGMWEESDMLIVRLYLRPLTLEADNGTLNQREGEQSGHRVGDQLSDQKKSLEFLQNVLDAKFVQSYSTPWKADFEPMTSRYYLASRAGIKFDNPVYSAGGLGHDLFSLFGYFHERVMTEDLKTKDER